MTSQKITYETIRKEYDACIKQSESLQETSSEAIAETDNYTDKKNEKLREYLNKISDSKGNLEKIKARLIEVQKSIDNELITRRQTEISEEYGKLRQKTQANINLDSQTELYNQLEKEYLYQMKEVVVSSLNRVDFAILRSSNRHDEINSLLNDRKEKCILVFTILVSVVLSLVSIIYSYDVDKKNDKDIEQFRIESIRNDSIINSKLDTIKMTHC